jgi:coenzyme F420 biosynthesis associated uncharacterized protein
MEPMIDWSLATQIARGVAKLQPAGEPGPFRLVEGPAEESHRLVTGYTGLEVETLPPPEAVSREEWIDANLTSLGGVLDPVASKLGTGMGALSGPVNAVAGVVLGAEAGAISGFLGGRVLGQYEFNVLEPRAPARLLFVAPNLGQAAAAMGADPEQLLRWVALHETTHALQFGGVPWLREHMAGTVKGLLEDLTVDPKRLLTMPDLRDLQGLRESVREGGVAALVMNPEQRERFDAMQAFMAVLEGYAEHVMDAVGVHAIPDLESLRSSLERRRGERSGFMRVFERLIGMDLKMKQYKLGKQFCDGAVARGGIDGLNRVWTSPEAMPTIAELDDPAGWLRRTEPPELDRAA